MGSSANNSLSFGLNIDGRHVWEPPILNYNHLIGNEYIKKREALLKYTQNNVSRTTEIMDIMDEMQIMWMYRNWSYMNVVEAEQMDKEDRRKFFLTLYEAVNRDSEELEVEYFELGVLMRKDEEGNYVVVERRHLPSKPPRVVKMEVEVSVVVEQKARHGEGSDT